MPENQSMNCSCGRFDTNVEYIIVDLLTPFIGFLGLTGYISSILFLRRSPVKSTFQQSLLVLFTLDSFLLILHISDSFFGFQHLFYILLYPSILYPMMGILQSSETFLIMSLSTERFLAVYKPIQFRGHVVRTSSSIHALVFILPPLCIALVLNISKTSYF